MLEEIATYTVDYVNDEIKSTIPLDALRGFPTFKSEIDPHFSKNEFLALFACYIICQYISLGSIVLKLFLTMKNTIFPIRPAGKCIQIQFIKRDWLFYEIVVS